jgi:mannosyltransferase
LNPVCLGNEKFIFHSSYYRTSKSKNALNITTIHDFTYEYFVKGIPRYTHHIQKANAINNSHGIICVSENTKKDLLHFFPKTDLKKIRVIYNGVSDKYKPLIKENDLTGKFGILNNKRYLLFLGSRAKYKNFKTAIEVIQLLQEFELVIIGGGKLTKQENVHLNTLIPDKFLYYSELNEEELNLLYNYAFCLLYPSSHEGFGIPILEAMCAGCPVVTTNKSSIPEVAGDAALFVDVIKAENFVKKVLLLTNKKQREIIISKGFEQSQKFSWDKCYQETRQVYKEVYEADINK